MNTHDELERNLAQVLETIEAACRRVQRTRSEITLIAVTKMHPAAAIGAAAELGITHIGENKVQEFDSKQPEWIPLRDSHKLHAHLIGHLQSNKAARAASLFDAIDSVDSLRLAERLDAAAAALHRTLPVLIEIKLSDEEAKSGLAPQSAEIEQLLERLADLTHLNVRGLMTVPPYLRDAEAVRPYFRQLRELRETYARRYPKLQLNALSMGMTHDYAVAIEEGATEIRLGTALFGARDYGKA
ncbi:MAG: dependent protein [Acidobacteriaceae bacterium]|jgi:pyridoxal phosphate enzyme (YggS family)|nr:dependent protein [Acidobacteriaceae bacterium]